MDTAASAPWPERPASPECPAYPRHSLGWLFARLTHRWRIPDARLEALLAVSRCDLMHLATCPAPLPDAPGFDARVDALARAFNIPRWRLAFVCRAAALGWSPAAQD